MRTTLDDRDRELLEAPNFAHVATLRHDGTPQVVPVWVDVDDDRVLLNSVEGRSWPRNLERDPRVTLTVTNMESPYEYVTIRGHLAEKTTEGADEHIDKLAKKYLGMDEYPYRRPDEVRVKIAVEPDAVQRRGG
jgi:PPOX class probable F420-dependent enzyme